MIILLTQAVTAEGGQLELDDQRPLEEAAAPWSESERMGIDPTNTRSGSQKNPTMDSDAELLLMDKPFPGGPISPMSGKETDLITHRRVKGKNTHRWVGKKPHRWDDILKVIFASD